MLICKAIRRYKDAKGTITGYRLKATNGDEKDFTASVLKNLIAKGLVEVTNLTLTSNGKLVISEHKDERVSKEPARAESTQKETNNVDNKPNNKHNFEIDNSKIQKDSSVKPLDIIIIKGTPYEAAERCTIMDFNGKYYTIDMARVLNGIASEKANAHNIVYREPSSDRVRLIYNIAKKKMQKVKFK